ncbi:serine hydrolase domain-containing protein [Aurantiacibacter sp. D1-12]|uniref:serine hydrolase domain-containing protein n=1 Tax=Aurantiacibacter sp. D1-12 TaxID=2993658 RepID=UPI00237D2BFA|nr:serine hydrolase domain-containing protein [Aurantiacibacter sp. D1-12]MDE1467354.1 serine hydrolase [Aurantiacibacter sp. D1-12]
MTLPAAAQEYAVATLTPNGSIERTTYGGERPDALYEAGSIGKFACTIAALRLVDSGYLMLDSSVDSLLPEFANTPIASITLRQLLASRSGLTDGLLPAFGADPARVMATPDAQTATANFAAGPLAFEPGTQWSYDLVNWVVVQAIVERVTGEPIAQVLNRNVLSPAGMGASKIFVGRVGDAGAVPVNTSPPLPTFLTCAGGLAATPLDLIALLRFAHMGGLSETSLAELMTVHTVEEDYALGGRFIRWDGAGETRLMSWQSGSNGAYKSLAVYDPLSDTGFAAMTAQDDWEEIESAREEWLAQLNDSDLIDANPAS